MGIWQDPAVTLIIRTWVSELGDNDVLSWLNTILYGVAFIAAICRWRRLPEYMTGPRTGRSFWLFLICVLFVLGVNKQMDFQTLLIEVGRYVARRDGWFEQRRVVQVWFACGLSVAAGCGVLLILVAMRGLWQENAGALAGLALLCVYAVVRAASTSHMVPSTHFLNLSGIRLTDLIELSGIACILMNALKRPREG